MNLKEQLASKKAELLALKEGVEAGDAEAVKAAAEIAEAIEAIQESIDEAAKAQAILASLNAEQVTEENPEKEKEDTVKNLGEFAVKSFEGKARQGERVNLSADYKAATDPQKLPEGMAGLTTYFDPNIVEAYKPRPNVIDLFGRETISGNALTFYVEGSVEGSVYGIDEGEAKPQVHFADPTPVTVALTKVAAFVKETDELLEDMPRLASVIENRLVYLHDVAREREAITTLRNTSGIQTKTITPAGTAVTAVELADGIYQAISNVQLATGFTADAIVMNPADFQILALGKDGNDQYYGGGYFGGAYGNGAYGAAPTVWGIPVVLTWQVNQGTFYVGAFRMGAAVVEKGGVRVEMTNSDQDDFIHNMVTLRVESRMALAVRYPAAFVLGSIQQGD